MQQENTVKKQKKGFKQRLKDFWNYFSTYEKIWYFSILILSVVFAFIFPEGDESTYKVSLNNEVFSSAIAVYDVVRFDGSEGEFAINAVIIDGTEYSMDYLDENGRLSEFSVISDDESTLTMKLPVAVNKDSEISFECYEDSDDGTLNIAITDESGQTVLFGGSVKLNEEFSDNSFSLEYHTNCLVKGWVITLLYLCDIILNITCELLISKQSKWNFIVSLGVEIVEIIVCIVCIYRFATMAVTLFFWIPCDIVSFVLWHRHPDKHRDELTVVKALKPWQDVLIVLGIIVWTAVVGFGLTFLDVDGGIFGNNVLLKNIACYIDACASAVGIVNGTLILLRYREQWIAWYICAALETVINIMAGQWILLILKAGYFTNTTYGYIQWTKYIRSKKLSDKVTNCDVTPKTPQKE